MTERTEIAEGRRVLAGVDNASVEEDIRLARKQQARMAKILDVVQAANSTLDLEEVVRCVRNGMMHVIPGSYCSFYLIPERRSMGLPPVRDASAPMDHQSVVSNPDNSEAIRTKMPVSCFDAESDPRTSKDLLRRFGAKSVLVVPLTVKQEVIALAHATLDHQYAFSQDEIDLIAGMANVLAFSVKNAYLYSRTREQTVLEERTRLAREMHDELAQKLGYLQLIASLTSDLLARNQVAEAKANVATLQDMISSAYADLRADIFNLRTVASADAGFVAAVLQYLADCRKYYGMDVLFEAPAKDRLDLSGAAHVQAIRILQEALINARKHAGARQVWVRIVHEGNRLCLVVEDDGRGFEPTSVHEPGRERFGLQVMRERAESVGGTLAVESKPGQGTRIVLRMPLSPDGGQDGWQASHSDRG